MQERGKSSFDKHLVAQSLASRFMTADQDIVKPIIWMEKEETPKTIVIYEICTVDIFFHSRKDLNENHES